MKNRVAKGVIAVATSLTLIGSGVAVAQDNDSSSQQGSSQQEGNQGSSNDADTQNTDSDSAEKLSPLPEYEFNGKDAPKWLQVVNAINVTVSVVGAILKGVLELVEGFKKLAPSE